MDWTAVITAAVGAAVGASIALAGVGIAEIGQSRRAKNAAEATAAARLEDRRAELWQISLPAAASAQKILASALRLSGPPTAANFHRDSPSFDDWFDEKFKDDAIELDRFIALIPSAVIREHLETVSIGIAFGYELARQAGYSRSYRTAVHKASRIGFDVVSAWMRDEQVIDAGLREQVVELKAAIGEFEEQYRIEHEDV